jgi:hypothetical protein
MLNFTYCVAHCLRRMLLTARNEEAHEDVKTVLLLSLIYGGNVYPLSLQLALHSLDAAYWQGNLHFHACTHLLCNSALALSRHDLQHLKESNGQTALITAQ